MKPIEFEKIRMDAADKKRIATARLSLINHLEPVAARAEMRVMSLDMCEYPDSRAEVEVNCGYLMRLPNIIQAITSDYQSTVDLHRIINYGGKHPAPFEELRTVAKLVEMETGPLYSPYFLTSDNYKQDKRAETVLLVFYTKDVKWQIRIDASDFPFLWKTENGWMVKEAEQPRHTSVLPSFGKHGWTIAATKPEGSVFFTNLIRTGEVK